ncbi:MAG: glycosyltransferase [Flavobacteriales bacterium]
MNSYLKKFGFQEPKINSIPNRDLGIVVVIPCHNEPDLIATLDSLEKCIKPNCEILILVVVNQSENCNNSINERNNKTIHEFSDWDKQERVFDYQIIHEDNLPKKHAGVGLARKIGMDEAVNLFYLIDTDGIIVALDADCEVETNYFIEIENHFIKHPKTPGCSIRYAHPLSGELENEIYSGIIQYELHLRYYNQALRMCEFPYAFHTVGSSMAVRSSAYQKQGGMNKRKAGEDFYFLQKIIELGGFTELNSTCVIPSPRISDRVPFGTGKAIGDFISNNSNEIFTYQFDSFLGLMEINKNLINFYEGNKYDINFVGLIDFLPTIDFENKLEEIRNNTTNYPNFKKRFFTFFNAFTVLKYMHFVRDNKLSNKPIEKESIKLLKRVYGIDNEFESRKEILETYRKIEANIS